MADDKAKLAFARLAQWTDIYNRAKLPRTLVKSPTEMRAAGTEYLPMWPLETSTGWQSRRDSTFLATGYKRAWSTAVGKAFGEPIALGDDVPKEIRGGDEGTGGLWENIDNAGSHGDVFAQWVFADSLHPGIGHILVEYPVATDVQTLDEERRAGLRPYWVYVPGDNVLGCRWEQVNGRMRLTQFRYQQTSIEGDGDFGEKTVNRARVYYAGDLAAPEGSPESFARFEVYVQEKGPTGGMEERLERAGIMRPHVEIPVSTFYARRTGYQDARPFLEDVAWANLEHWQSSSDQRHILHFARVPTRAFYGFSREDIQAITSVGPSAAIFTTKSPQEAKAEILETSGAAVGEGWKDLERIKAEIREGSMEPMVSPFVAETATGRAIEEARAHSALEAAIRNFEDCLEEALRLTAVWLGLKDGDGGSVSLTERLSPQPDEAEKFRGALELFKANAIGKRTLLERAKAMHVLAADEDVDALLDGLEAEGQAALGMPGGDLAPDAAGAVGVDGQAAVAGALPNPEDTMLNGAQISAATAIVRAVAAGEIPRDAAIGQLVILYRLNDAQANRMLGSAGTGAATKPNINPADKAKAVANAPAPEPLEVEGVPA